MTQASLVYPVAKLDIKDLLKPSLSPPPTTPSKPSPFSRSTSVPSSCTLFSSLPSPSSTSTASHYSATTVPPVAYSHHQRRHSRQLPAQSNQPSTTAQAVSQQSPKLDAIPETATSNKRPLPAEEQPIRSPPAKKQSKWSPTEDAKIIRLRGKGMKWEDISKELPGRSAISCRLHYQNYLERRSEWDEEKRNKLARLYDRLKPELWNPIAVELGVPWRAAEAMHWALGEQDMARRANVTAFSIAAARAEPHEPGCGRVAQRDRMLENTRVFEGRDLTTLSSPFASVKGHGNRQIPAPASAPFGVPPAAHMHIAPIKDEQTFTGFDETENLDDEDNEAGSKGRKRRSGEMRLPGFAELDGEIQAFRKDGWVKVERDESRRGSGGSLSNER